ncbi:hypothetical protein MMC18_009269 [Xylographa bjoerkii]|nr:hypothetical protein [Xylographa bjoerkii]
MAPIIAASAPTRASFISPISEQTFIITQSILLGVAILNTAARTRIRWSKFKAIYKDDYILFLALASLVASTVMSLYTYIVSRNYDSKQAELASIDSIMISVSSDLLLWLTIYCVKFSFLFYFKGLIQRNPKLIKWWWIVLIIIVPCAVGTVFGAFIICPEVSAPKMFECVTGPNFLSAELITVYFSVFADIATDVLLLSIPCCLLSQLQIELKQKFAIGFVLCCSVFMIAIALLRGISTYIRGTSDQIWTLFWINTQANVSVITVCFTAWRTFYLQHATPATNARERNNARNCARAQKLPRRSCWPWKANSVVSDIHLQQLKENQGPNGTGSSGTGSNGVTSNQNASGNTSGTEPENGTELGHIPAGFLRSDSYNPNMGTPELRRISRLLPGDRVFVVTQHPAPVSTESFV